METKPLDEAAAADKVQPVDRRRPGRIEDASPELVALMRAPARGPVGSSPGASVVITGSTDDLQAARGVSLAVGISILIWAVAIGAVVWL